MLRHTLTAALLVSLGVTEASANEIIDVAVYHNEVQASIELANGIEADITLTFEQAAGLTAESIGLGAQLVDPLDPLLQNRLPSGPITILGAFPLLLSVAPPTEGTLSFQGIVTVGIHTHNLGYAVGSPFRLFVAEHGGTFQDITDRAGSGSYRVRGSRGEFSEFMIVADLRVIETVIMDKYNAVDRTLNKYQAQINPELHQELAVILSASRAAYNAGDEVGAIRDLDSFTHLVRANAGGAIPNLWRSRDDIVNFDGVLRSLASTLRYSLALLSNDLP